VQPVIRRRTAAEASPSIFEEQVRQMPESSRTRARGQGLGRGPGVAALVSGLVSLALTPALLRGQEGGEAQQNARATAPSATCITPAAERKVAACPSNAPRAKAQPSGEAPTSRFRDPEKEETDDGQAGPTGPSVELDLATRLNRDELQARQWDLLVRESQLLQRLVQNTRTSDPRRPDVLLRLAETYFEMQVVKNREVRSFDEPLYQARQSKNANRVRDLQRQQQQAQQELDRYRQEGIRTYATLVQDHPQYNRMDEVLFSLAFALEEMREYDRARRVYYRLIRDYPQSKFVPHAWLAFAEYYFNEGEMREAIQFYEKVTQFPPAENPVYGYALYKSAWALYNLDDFRGALEKFTEVIEFAQQNPDARDAENLSRQSRRELVLPYAMVGTPSRALAFFRRYAADENQAIEMFESLGELYYDTGQWPETIEVYQKLMAERSRSDQVCYWQSRVSNAIVSSKPKPEQVEETARMVRLYELFQTQDHSAESKTQCKQLTAGLLFELATAWHREAIGTDSQPGTNDVRTMTLASQLYQVAIEKFPDMEDLEFPTIDRRDWPTVYKVRYYYAELLWKMENWEKCGPAFDAVVEQNPRGEYTTDAAYAAVLCYNNLYQQRYAATDRLSPEERRERERRAQRRNRRRGREEPEEESKAPREFSELEEGMLQAFQRYVCFIPDSDELPTIKYRRARIFYEAQHYEEAALLFKDIAYNHTDSELSEYAANLYLDSLNILGTQLEEPRTACVDGIADSIQPLRTRYCDSEAKQAQYATLCPVLTVLRCNIKRKQAEIATKEERYEDNIEITKSILRDEECMALGDVDGDGEEDFKPDELLWNLAINYEAARLIGPAIRVRQRLVELYPDSPLSKRAIYLIGANYHALALYEQAADYYERFAERFPGEDGSDCTEEDQAANVCAVASDALQTAVLFRLGLGDIEKARDDAELFERSYRRKLPRETATVNFSLCTIPEQEESWNGMFRCYRSFLRGFRRSALPQQLMHANLGIGKAFWNTDEKDKSEKYFESAWEIWEKGAAEKINAMEDLSEAERTRMVLEAKTEASEALFYLAEYKFFEFRRVRFPNYRGGRSMSRMERWVEKEFIPWMQEKSEALAKAQTEYEKIAELEIPQWEIAAAARVGEMYRTFMDQIEDAPVPEEIENDVELMDIYNDTMEQRLRPLREQAIDKFAFCLITSTRVRWFNEFSRQCESELNALAPTDYPMAAELRGSPDLAERRLPLPGPADLGRSAEEEAAAETATGAAAPATRPDPASLDGEDS